MTLVQAFDLYQLSDAGTDRGGSPIYTVVRVFDGAVGTFVTPSAKTVDEWFGEGSQFNMILLVRNNLANNPIGAFSIHVYLDLDEFPFLYVVPKNSLSVYMDQPFRVSKIVKSPRPGTSELVVVGLTRFGPEERVEMQDGVLVPISG